MKEVATFSKRIRSGDAAVGTLITTGSAENADVLAACGFDWLFLDCEHGAIDAAQAQLILQVVGRRIPTIIRVPENAEVSLKKTLDLGCEGVIVPMVNTPMMLVEPSPQPSIRPWVLAAWVSPALTATGPSSPLTLRRPRRTRQ